MKRETLLKMAEDYVMTSPFNNIGPHTRDAENYYGLHIFDKPLMCIGRADDPMWKVLQKPEAVGPQMALPTEWVPGAKSVISFFFPACKKIKEETAKDKEYVPKEWLFARTDAQWVMFSLLGIISDELKKEGYKACVPSDDPRFTFRGSLKEPAYGGRLSNFQEYGIPEEYEAYTKTDAYARIQSMDFPLYNSNWSERHTAFVCGLGTFSISTNLITEKGCSGRFLSIVTDWEPEEYDERPYKDYMEYCTRCGACIKCCPGHAMDETGKDKKRCHDYFQGILYSYDYIPRYGCGKCQTNMPCDGGIPGR